MTRDRTAGQAGVAWVSDGWEPYATTIEGIYRDPVPTEIRNWVVLRLIEGIGLTQAVKQRRGRRLIRVEVRATIGTSVAQPYPVHVERFNGVLRDRLACLTRKTHAFAKDARTWDAAFSLAVFEQNWIRPHSALRVPLAEPCNGHRYQQRTPAMAIGLATRPWSLVEFLTRPKTHGL